VDELERRLQDAEVHQGHRHQPAREGLKHLSEQQHRAPQDAKHEQRELNAQLLLFLFEQLFNYELKTEKLLVCVLYRIYTHFKALFVFWIMDEVIFKHYMLC